MPLLAAALFSRRFDLWLGNPNTTAALLGMLLVSAWVLLPAGGWRRVLALAISLPLGLLLAFTSSRGGMAALAAGAVVLAAAWGIRRRSRADFAGLAVAMIWCVAAFALTPSAARRIQRIPQDSSVTVRGTIYSKIPEMIVAAPGGWGVGRSAEAYHYWFAPVGDTRRFLHVLSTHGVWLVERGWPMRILYIGGWALALLWAWPGRRGRLWWAGGFGCLVVFGVAGLFSHVGERLVMWLPVVLWLLAITADRLRTRALPSRRSAGVAAGAVLGLVLAVIGAGWCWQQTPRVSLGKGIVTIERPGGTPSLRIGVVAEQAVVGEWFGQQIRAELPPRAKVEFLWDAGSELGTEDCLFLAGRSAGVSEAGHETTVWINPPIGVPSGFSREDLSRTWIYWGIQRSGSAHRWREALAENPGHFKYLPMSAEFVTGAWRKFLAAGNDGK